MIFCKRKWLKDLDLPQFKHKVKFKICEKIFQDWRFFIHGCNFTTNHLHGNFFKFFTVFLRAKKNFPTACQTKANTQVHVRVNCHKYPHNLSMLQYHCSFFTFSAIQRTIMAFTWWKLPFPSPPMILRSHKRLELPKKGEENSWIASSTGGNLISNFPELSYISKEV